MLLLYPIAFMFYLNKARGKEDCTTKKTQISEGRNPSLNDEKSVAKRIATELATEPKSVAKSGVASCCDGFLCPSLISDGIMSSLVL